MERIYLDNSATTEIDPKVIAAMNESYSTFGNPSSLHSFGQDARKAVDGARDFVAFFLDCKPTEVTFTSGGSEADNLAIRGIVDSIQITDSSKKPHVVTSTIEHHAVLHTIQDLENEGKIEATYINPGKNGIIKVSDIEAAIQPNTILVSIMYVNNEVGTVQPIREIGKLIESANKLRDKNLVTRNSSPVAENKFGRIYFHCDAVQAAEFFEMGTKYLHVDLLTLTAHKIHGPKGVGVLFVKKGTPIAPQVTGGDQEFRLRAGTENVAGIVGLAEALRQVSSIKYQVSSKITGNVISNDSEKTHVRKDLSPCSTHLDGGLAMGRDDNFKKVERLRDKLEQSALENIPDTFLNGDKKLRAPHITNISFKNAEGEAIILNLDFLGIAVSSGSACTARSLEPSHVLTAMDVPHELSHGAIRFSLSRETTEVEIDRVLEVLPGIIEKIREMSPFK